MTLLFVLAVSPTPAAPLPEKDTPLDWVYPAPAPLRVHIVRGLWSREYRLEESLALASAGFVTESWHAQGMGFGYVGGWDPNSAGNVPEFPDTAEDLLGNHVLVIGNINAKAFSPAQQKLILGFVRNGGGVLLLGGRFAFGSQWTNTPLADLAPVSFVQQGFDLTNAVEGLTMAAGPDRLGENPAVLHWEKTPRVFWYHEVKPKPGSCITVVAGGNPLLIAGTCGKGRVALFAGSVMGEPPAGTLPLWQWDDWPRLMAETLAWLAAPRDSMNGALNPSVRQELLTALAPLKTLMEVGEAQAALAAAEPLLWRAGKLCREPEVLEQALQIIAAGEADPEPALADFLGRRAAALPGKQAETLATKLVASGKPGKTAMGLRLLGASRSAGTVDTLLRFLASGEVATLATEAALDNDGLSMEVISVLTPAQKTSAAAFIRMAALEGLASLGDPKALPAIRKSVAASRPGGRFVKAEETPGSESFTITSDHRLYQTGLFAALACGEATVAGPLAEALLGNVHVASSARSGWNGPKDADKTEEGSLPYILAWQAKLHTLLQRCPVERLTPLAGALAALDDIRIVPSACAAFGGRPLTPEIKAALKTSKVRGVALIADSPR